MMMYVIDSLLAVSGKLVYALFNLFGFRFVCLTGKLIAHVYYHLDKKRRRFLEKELKLIFEPENDRHNIKQQVKRAFENHFIRQTETIFFGALGPEQINRMITVQGLRNLDQALSREKGVILLVSHFGAFLLPLPFLGYQGYHINQVTGRQRFESVVAERIWWWRKREADKLPVKYLQVDTFLRPIFGALKNNEIITIAFDGRDSKKWVETDFFGRRARFSSGPFELARRTGAAIVPAFVIREANCRHRLILEKPLDLKRTESQQTAAITDTHQFARLFCEYVKRYPCHFVMTLYTTHVQWKKGILPPFFAETENA